jgi:uncharacterized protein
MRQMAGTKSKVFFVLSGDSGSTEVRKLEGVEHRVRVVDNVTNC